MTSQTSALYFFYCYYDIGGEFSGFPLIYIYIFLSRAEKFSLKNLYKEWPTCSKIASLTASRLFSTERKLYLLFFFLLSPWNNWKNIFIIPSIWKRKAGILWEGPFFLVVFLAMSQGGMFDMSWERWPSLDFQAFAQPPEELKGERSASGQ